MRVEKHNYQKMILSDRELNALNIVNEMLLDLQDNIYESASLESQVSGEIVQIKELARVRGILSFFAEMPYQIFEVKDLEDEKISTF